MGCDIPFRKFNCNSLEDFLRSEPSLDCRPGPQGMIIDARLTEKSAHIARMISAQKDNSAKRSKRKAFVRYGRRPARHDFQHNPGYSGHYANRYNAGPPRFFMPPGMRPMHPGMYPMPPRPHDRSPLLVNQNSNRGPPQNKRVETAQGSRQPIKTVTDLRENIKPRTQPDDRELNLEPSRISKEQVPHSSKTNRSMLLNQQGSNISPTQLKTESLKAFDPENSVWAFSSDSGGEDNLKGAQPKKIYERTGDPIEDLKIFLKINHHPAPDIKILKRQIKFRKPQFFDCKIVAGGKTFSNYPKDFTNEAQVTKYTCAKALDELIPLLQSAAPTASLLVSDDNDVLQRVPPMIEQHSNGIWNEQLERLYADKYKEMLPINWLKIIENSPVISVQQASKTLHLLTYCKPGDFLQKGKLSDVQKNRMDLHMHSTVSIAANHMTLDDNAVISVETLCVESAGEIWCRQSGTKEASDFDQMSIALTRTYLNARSHSMAQRPERIIVGGHYAVLHNDLACRVQVLELTLPAEDQALCFYVDYGDAQQIRTSEIFTLDAEFANIQAQAFSCRLQGLEELYDYSTESDILAEFVGNAYYMQKAPKTDNEVSEADEVMGVYFYDVETNVQLNEDLENRLIVESAVPYLSDTAITDVVVMDVQDTGDIFVQLRPNRPGFNKLMELQGKFNEAITNNESWVKAMPVVNKETCGDDKIFIAKSTKDNRYYRATVNDWEPSGRFLQILFIDFGYTEIIKPSDAVFYDVNQFSEMLQDFEGQALRIRLDIDEIPDHFAKLLTEIVGDRCVLAKLVHVDENDIPIVKLFKRVLPDNILASINETIVLNHEKRPEKPTTRELLRTQSKNSPSSGELKTPDIPVIGSFFDVNVPNAVSPWNFFIQPWQSNLKLEKLMESLQQRYNKDAQYSPLSMDDIIPGKVYAARHPESEVWHRTSVTKVINPQSISAYYVDYGYYFNLHSNQLMPLDIEFLELPYQAVKAKLTGVKPKNNKWTMGDCELFRKLVTGKQFVSVIEDTETDEFCPSDVVLCLRLVNTRGEQDVHIGDVLIQKDIAVACPKKEKSPQKK